MKSHRGASCFATAKPHVDDHLEARPIQDAMEASDLSLEDGQLLGEVLVNQVKRAKKKGGWRKSAELGKVGVDQVRNCEERSDELQIR